MKPWHKESLDEHDRNERWVTIFYKDWGPNNAQPIFFHHGWPLSADDWDTHMLFHQGLPHGMCTTHADVVNADLLAFVEGK